MLDLCGHIGMKEATDRKEKRGDGAIYPVKFLFKIGRQGHIRSILDRLLTHPVLFGMCMCLHVALFFFSKTEMCITKEKKRESETRNKNTHDQRFLLLIRLVFFSRPI